MKTERKVVSATVYCVGLKKRCRRADRHAFDVTDAKKHLPLSEWEKPEVQERIKEAAEFLIRSQMKALHPTARVTLSVQELTLEEDPAMPGLVITKFQFGEGLTRFNLTPELAGFPTTDGKTLPQEKRHCPHGNIDDLDCIVCRDTAYGKTPAA